MIIINNTNKNNNSNVCTDPVWKPADLCRAHQLAARAPGPGEAGAGA